MESLNRKEPFTTEKKKAVNKNYVKRLRSVFQEPAPKKRKQPFSYQVKAINDVVTGFASEDRGQLIMPCGSGKTLVSLWINEGLSPQRTLVLFPSLALLRQTKDEWNKECVKDVPYLCVCSEQDIDNSLDHVKVLPGEVDSRVTSNPQEIASFLGQERESIIYSTYQSLPAIGEAMKGSGISFDLVLCDEAHKTAGGGDSCFKMVHDNEAIPAKKRLYMTATPKVFSNKSDNPEQMSTVVDMSNPDVFGKEFHRLGFRDAIDQGILVDYKVIVVGVTEEEVLSFQNSISKGKETHNDLIYNFALQKFMEEWGAKNVITFHSSVKKARGFTEAHKTLFPEVEAFHVNGEQTTSARQEALKSFGKSQKATVSNARCLTEGVDVPTVDAVFFCDPKSSYVDIMQGLGRALRRADHRNKTTGYIVIPTLHTKEEGVEGQMDKGRFKTLLKVISAINSYDHTFMERLKEQVKAEKESTGSAKETATHEERALEIVSANVDFGRFLYTQCLSSLTKWLTYKDLKVVVKEQWIRSKSQYKKAHKKGLLPEGAPANPWFFYDEYEGAYEFFGKPEPSKKMNYEELKIDIRNRGIKSRSGYTKAYKEGILPKGAPGKPWKFYGEYTDSYDFFSKPKPSKKLSYEELKIVVREQGIRSWSEYTKLYKEGLLPEGAPAEPWKFYDEYADNYDFFSKPKPSKKLSYEELKIVVRQHGIKSKSQYTKLYKEGILPEGVPSQPWAYYPEYEGAEKFFGKEKDKTSSKNKPHKD